MFQGTNVLLHLDVEFVYLFPQRSCGSDDGGGVILDVCGNVLPELGEGCSKEIGLLSITLADENANANNNARYRGP